MADLRQETNKLESGRKTSLPSVFCTPMPSNDQNNTNAPHSTSESKLTLPSNLATPNSPLKISSPFSLPCSPNPYSKDKTQRLPDNSGSHSQPTLSIEPQQLKAPTLVNNTSSATGNPRNKCALQPGHSLMDWIRLGNSGKDLTGVGGRIRPVSPDELALHNTHTDAWLAIRGRVYNITHYLPYHPGGPEELMRGAGIDATQLFDKVHPWVNYDSLLAKCLIGPLRIDRPDSEELFGPSNPSLKSDRLREPSKAQELVRKSMENIANCITPVRKKITAKSEENVKSSPPSKIMQSLIQSSDLPVSISRRAASSPGKTKSPDDAPSQLRFDWIQTSTKLTLSVYTSSLANPGACARLNEGVLLIEVATDGWLRIIKLIPEAKLIDQLQLRIYAESGKIEVTAQKAESSIWKSCGDVTSLAAIKVTSPRTVECSILAASSVSHDTVLLAAAPKLGPVIVPLGYHIRVHKQVEGPESECVRSYTPIGDGWGSESNDFTGCLKLAIKKYESGTLSLHLFKLQVDDNVNLSGPYGNFQLSKLRAVKTLYLIAAGTGITPMLGLIKFMIARSNPKCEQLCLLFFNKTEEDILFRDNFDNIAKEDSRFTSIYILSNPSPTWSGPKGRLSSELLAQILPKDSFSCIEDCTHFACVCGPTEFTHTGLDVLKGFGMKENCIHAFMG